MSPVMVHFDSKDLGNVSKSVGIAIPTVDPTFLNIGLAF